MWLVTQKGIEGKNGEEVTFEDTLTKKFPKQIYKSYLPNQTALKTLSNINTKYFHFDLSQ